MNDTNDIKENEHKEAQDDKIAVCVSAEENFRKVLKTVNSLYLYAVIISSAVVLAGLVYAVMIKVSVGLVIAISGVLLYTALTSTILYRQLGISYRSTSGALTVTQLYGQGRDEIWIPERLLWVNVTEIGDRAFKHKSSAGIRTVHLPATLKVVGENIFEGCDELKTVCFGGNRDDWKQIESSTDFSAYELIFNSDAEHSDTSDDAENVSREAEEQ